MDRDSVLHEWRAFIERLPTQEAMKPFILQSWERSREAGVEAEPAEIVFRQVPEDELRRRLTANRELIALAEPHLKWLSAALTPITHAVYLTDRDGIVLCARGDEAMKQAFGVIPGYDWS